MAAYTLMVMGKATSSPKCKTCGKIEPRHICGGLPESVRARFVKFDHKKIVDTVDFVERTVNPPVFMADEFPVVVVDGMTAAEAAKVYPAAEANVPGGVMSLEPGTIAGFPPPSAKIARKEYLKLKAGERRKRERAEADKLNLSVAEYRARKGK